MPRTGRGRTLTRPQRGKVWKVFEEYRSALKDKGKHEWLLVIQETRQYLEKKKSILPYRAVVVDESQDFHPEEWKLIRALVPQGPNDLFLVGDAHQRIYGRKVVLKDCGIQIQGRSSQLKINYRTTEQIRDWVDGHAAGRGGGRPRRRDRTRRRDTSRCCPAQAGSQAFRHAGSRRGVPG